MSDQGDGKPSIEPIENGPYIVLGLENLSNSRGDDLETQGRIALCRCGHSSKKPFCDGTHKKVGFSSAKETDGGQDKRDDYVGAEATIHDNRGICSHLGYCTDGLKSVFKYGEEPWIDPDGASAEEIAAQAKRCPSGALSVSIDGVEHRDHERNPAIHVSKDGPYYVTGGCELQEDQWGEGASHEHFTLCRCGGSKNKPFCDGAHWSIEFKDPDN